MVTFSVKLWLGGLASVVRRLFAEDDGPRGQIGGVLSPLLETMRTGHAARWIEGERVLDCGCGRGKLLERLGTDVSYTGVDHDIILVRYLRRRYPNAQFLSAELESLDFSPMDAFDSVVMLALIEHLVSPEVVLKQLASFVRPGGLLILTTPTPLYGLLLHAGSRIGLFDRHADEDHKQLMNRAELEGTLARVGLQLERQYRFLFGGNQLVVARKPSA